MNPPPGRLPESLAGAAPRAVFRALPGARAVGGCVRDALAGLPVHDLDMAAPFPPEEISERLRRAGFRVFETGLAHGTVTAVLDGTPIEVTALRRDVATDGRHAEVAWTTDWHEDAARRDFTINSMSMDAEGLLHDDHGGAVDLRAGRVRFVGDPATRLAEDYLRALRFFRFQARYGRGAPDPAAVGAIRAAVPGLARLSAERVWSELKRLLAAPDPTGAIGLMHETGVLGAVLPEAAAPDLNAARRLVAAGAPRSPALWLPALSPRLSLEAAASLARRLRLSNDEADDLLWLTRPEAGEMPSDEDAFLRWLVLRDPRRAMDEAWLAEGRDHPGAARLRTWLAQAPVLRFPLRGRDALAAGIPPGPAVGQALARVRDWWQAEGGQPDRDACLARLRELAEAGTR